MTDARRYRSLFSRRRVAPPTPHYRSPTPVTRNPRRAPLTLLLNWKVTLTSLVRRMLCTLLALKPIILMPPMDLRGRASVLAPLLLVVTPLMTLPHQTMI
ncbi:hypothetical protein PIB30_096963, partial [Stylosanthes scabra]|nr:hypothetical protein [Stylosanthes scabra]